MAPDQKKITVKVFEPLLTLFMDHLKSCFIQRDAFVNHILTLEIEHLAKDLEGKRLSDKARRHITRSLRDVKAGTKTINIVVDNSVSKALGKVVVESNLVRDAFFNRLFLFLCAKDELLSRLHLPTDTSDRFFNQWSFQRPTAPMGAVSEVLSDPLWALREACQDTHEEGLYLIHLGTQYDGFACWMDDASVPGTSERRKLLRGLDVKGAARRMAALEKQSTSVIGKKE